MSFVKWGANQSGLGHMSSLCQVAQFKLGQALGTSGLSAQIGDASVKRTERVILSNAFAEADIDGDGVDSVPTHLYFCNLLSCQE